MGFLGIFSDHGAHKREKSSTDASKKVEKSVSEEIEKHGEAEKTVLQNLVWSRKGKHTDLSFSADPVQTIKNETAPNGFDVKDSSIWADRINDIFTTIDDTVERHQSTYAPVPVKVDVRFYMAKPEAYVKKTSDVSTKEVRSDESADAAQESKDVASINVREPRWKFSDVYIAPRTKTIIDKSLLIARHRKELFQDWGLGNGQQNGRAIVFNFYGPSGTGKSMTAEAIAGMLGKKVYAVNYSELESKYVGETPKNIEKVFRLAKEDDAVLIFDEADSFLGKRLTNVTQSADYGVNITRSVMLLELEQFDGIVIFTTNLISNYDEAFKRRILASVPFEMPDVTAREQIWQLYLQKGVPLAGDVLPATLAAKYENISGADIRDIVLYAAVNALERDEQHPKLQLEDFEPAYRIIRDRKAGNTPVHVTHERISEEQYHAEMTEAKAQEAETHSEDLFN